MVYFITGPIQSGKSTHLYKIYNSLNHNKADGFYNIKCYFNNKNIGQDIIHMSSGNRLPFSRINGFFPDGWDEGARIYNYSFSKKGLDFAEDIVYDISNKNKTAFIDELGPLELNKSGLYSCFNDLLKKDIDIYAVCRDSCLDLVIKEFKIKNFAVLKRK